MDWVSLLFVTQLDFATDPSATMAGAAARLDLGLDVGITLVDRLELGLGYRWLTPSDSEDELVATDGHRLMVGPRFRAPVSEHWSFVFALEAEATYLDLAVELPESTGSAGDWAFGVTPLVALDAAWPTEEDLAVGFRLQVGYGFRTTHDFHAVHLSAPGTNVAPLDLGDLNLSGFQCGVALRVAFR